jgi:hypothetical protein
MNSDDVIKGVRDHAGLFTEHRPIDEVVVPTAESFAGWGVGLEHEENLLALMRYAFATRDDRAPEDVSEADMKFIAGLVHGFAIGVRAQALDSDGGIKTPKNGKARLVVVAPEARAALADLVIWPDVPWLFVAPRGGRFSRSLFYYYWKPVKAVFVSRHPERASLVPYSLRHFCATELLRRGVSEADAAYQLGHQDGGRLVREVYGHREDAYARERLREAFGTQPVAVLNARRARLRAQAVESGRYPATFAPL